MMLLILLLTLVSTATSTEYGANVQADGVHQAINTPLLSNKVLLPLSTGAACLDGSPYAFYYTGNNNTSTRWSITLGGGGWCYNESLCAARAASKLGSSTMWPDVGECECKYFDTDGQTDDAEQCKCASLIYCDGASFSGVRSKLWPVDGPGRAPSPNNVSHLAFRGLLNLDSALDWLVSNKGLGNASELVVTGGSAGGLSTFLHTDRIASRAPLAKVRALPVVGYFLNHAEMSGAAPDYRASMDYVRVMQNITASPGGALNAACMGTHPTEKWKCIMSRATGPS